MGLPKTHMAALMGIVAVAAAACGGSSSTTSSAWQHWTGRRIGVRPGIRGANSAHRSSVRS